jgi:hypothetical protein
MFWPSADQIKMPLETQPKQKQYRESKPADLSQEHLKKFKDEPVSAAAVSIKTYDKLKMHVKPCPRKFNERTKKIKTR